MTKIKHYIKLGICWICMCCKCVIFTGHSMKDMLFFPVELQKLLI